MTLFPKSAKISFPLKGAPPLILRLAMSLLISKLPLANVISVSPCSIMAVRFVQPPNASDSMFVTFWGILIDVRLLQP